MTELFVPVGHRQGVRPGDLVGALTNEFGVPGNAIGRITIAERKSFVGVVKEVAARLLAESPVLTIRGTSARISQARSQPGPPRSAGPGGPGAAGDSGPDGDPDSSGDTGGYARPRRKPKGSFLKRPKAKGWAKSKAKSKAKANAKLKARGKLKSKGKPKPKA